MLLRGFDEQTMKKVFDWFLHDKFTYSSSGKKRPFQTRQLSHTGKGI